MNKKLVSVVLTATTVVWGLGIATLPLANAQTTASLQAQIAALLAQIQQLQAQLNSAKGTSTSTSYNFTRDLTVGSKGADVSALQQILINAGDLNISAPTGYFGPLTKAALAKYQAANGIKPAAGYFGPITRAFIASSGVAGTGTGTGSSTSTTGTVTPPTTGLAVSLASDNPSAGSLITTASGFTGGTAARVPVLAVNLTASNSGAVTVTDLKFHKTGVLSDSSISGAYLIQNGQVLYQYTSLNQGVIDFSSMNLTVPAGQTEELQLAIDPSSGLSAGNTVSFAMNAASDVTAVDSNNNAITASGSFPLNGSIFTVTTVSNPSLAQLTVTSTPVGTQVTAGTQNNIVSAWQLTGSNSLGYLKGLKFTVIGSANNSDIRNVKLNINGTQVGPTLATVGTNGVAYFDLSSSPASINTGSNNLQVYADVMGSPSKNFQFEILNSYDVYAVDSQYNVPISVTVNGGAGTQVAIAQGTITVTQDSGTPTGNIAVGQSGVTLAKFDIYAAGEPVKVKFLDFELDFTTSTSNPTLNNTLTNAIKNVALVDDAGGQVGSTINNPPSSNTCTATNATASYSTSTEKYLDCFGTSASPINYIVPANTTRVLSLKADIQSGAKFATVQAKLSGDTDNLQGLTSSQTNSSAGANGSALTLQTGLLTVAENTAYGDQTIQPGTSNVKIGSYSFSASSASGVQMNTVSVKVYPNGLSSNDIANLKLMIGGTQFGTTQGVVTDGSTYTFSGSPFTVPAGGTTNVDVYADVLSGATTTAQTASEVTACTGTSVVSYNSVSCPSGAVTGQSVTASSAGADVSVGLDSSAPAASQLVANTSGNTLAAFRFSETSNVANVNLTDLKVTQNTSSSLRDFGNVYLYDGSTNIGTGVVATSSAGYTYSFHFTTPPVIPLGETKVLTLKGDVPPYNSGSIDDNTTSTFAIAATSDVTALTAGSQKAAVVSGTPTGNTMTVLQTTLTPSATALESTGIVRRTPDQAATITVTAASGSSAVLRTLRLTFSGSAIGASTTAADFVLLHNSVDVTTSTANSGMGASATGTCNASPCSITWSFPTSTTSSAAYVTAGGSLTFTLQFNSADFATATGQNPVSINAVISGIGDMTYYDNGTASGSTIALPVTTVPLTIVTVQYSS